MRNLRDVLEQSGGYLVFPYEEEEFVLISKIGFEKRQEKKKQTQLNLTEAKTKKDKTEWDDASEEVSQELGAPYNTETDAEPIEEFSPELTEDIKKVRFESIRGDLPPELQE